MRKHLFASCSSAGLIGVAVRLSAVGALSLRGGDTTPVRRGEGNTESARSDCSYCCHSHVWRRRRRASGDILAFDAVPRGQTAQMKLLQGR